MYSSSSSSSTTTTTTTTERVDEYSWSTDQKASCTLELFDHTRDVFYKSILYTEISRIRNTLYAFYM